MEAHAPLCALVGLNNRVRMTDHDRDQPWKPPPSAADLPELMMFPTDGEALTAGTSSSSFAFVQRFTIIVSSDEMRTNRERSPNAVKSAVMGALLSCKDRLPGCNTNLVRPTKWTDRMGTTEGQDEEKRATGWTCTLTVEVAGAQSRSDWQ